MAQHGVKVGARLLHAQLQQLPGHALLGMLGVRGMLCLRLRTNVTLIVFCLILLARDFRCGADLEGKQSNKNFEGCCKGGFHVNSFVDPLREGCSAAHRPESDRTATAATAVFTGLGNGLGRRFGAWKGHLDLSSGTLKGRLILAWVGRFKDLGKGT